MNLTDGQSSKFQAEYGRELSRTSPPLWQSPLFPALAGGMDWEIRGPYGHETGAMLAGLLVGLVLALL